MQIRTLQLVRCTRKTERPSALRWFWPLLLSLLFVAPSFGQVLTQVKVTPSDTVAGNGTVYTVSFITSAGGSGLPNNGRIRLTFPVGFGVSGVLLAGPITPPNGITGGFLNPTVAAQVVTLTRDGTGAAVAAEDTAVFKMAVVGNPTLAGTYSLLVETLTNAGTLIDSAPSDLFRIGVGPLAYVKVYNLASGNTSEVGTNMLTADQTLSMHAAGFDSYGNYRGDVSVNWSASGNIGTLSTPAGISTTFSANKAGNGLITADHPSSAVIDGVTGNLTVVPGALAKVIVVAGSNGDGPPLGTYSMTTDQSLPVHAAAYDADNNYIQDESVTWTLTGDGIGTISPATGTTTTLEATTPGTGVINANHATLVDDASGTITINIGALHHVKILSGSNGPTTEVTTSSLNSGQTLQVHAGGFDADDNYIGDVSVNWSVTGGIGSLSNATGINTTLTAETGGAGVINADHPTPGIIGDATGGITVSAGTLAKVKVVQGSSGDGTEMGPATFTTDNSPVVHAAGYDTYNNYVGDQVVTWGVTGGIGTVSPSSGMSTTLNLTTPGNGTVIATHATVADDTSGTITVDVGAAYRVKILTSSSGNTSELTAQTLTAGATLVIHAGSFDVDGNYVGDVSVNWSASSGVGTLNPTTGISTTLTATGPGNGIITADHATLVDGFSPRIDVSGGSLSYVRIVEGPAGNSAALEGKALTTDQLLTVHAAGYDGGGNYLGDFSVTWSHSNGAAGSLSQTTGAATTFNPTRAGTTTTITAVHATLGSDTVNVKINLGAPHHVKVLSGANGNNPEVTTQSLPSGGTLTVHASSFDADDNRIGDVSVNWVLTGGIGNLSPTSGLSTTLFATKTGEGTITADHLTLLDDATGPITVTGGTLSTVKIVEGLSGNGPEMGGKSLTTDQTLPVHAAGYDANGNYISDVLVTWSVSGGIGSVSPASGTSTTLTLTTPGSGRIRADHASAADDSSGIINVSAGNAHHVKILSGLSGLTADVTTDTLQVGNTLPVHAGSFDAHDNYVSDVSVTWIVTGGIGSLSSTVNTTTTLTAQTAGSGAIFADHPTLLDDATGTIVVTAGTLAKIRIVEGESGNGPELLDKTATTDETITVHAAGYDAADNYLGDVSVNWSVTNGIGTFSATTGPSTRLNLTKVASGTITADHATIPDDLSGTITVIAGNPQHVTVLSGSNGNTSAVDAQNLTTGANLVVHAGSFDADGNYTGDVNVAWTVTGSIGNVAPLTGTSTTFTATSPGTGTISADHPSLIDDATGTITVTTGTLSYVRILDGPSGNTPEVNARNLTTDQPLIVHAAGFDASSSYLGDFSVNWSVTGGIGVLSTNLGVTTTLDPRTPGTGIINATYPTGGVTGDATGNITVVAGAPNRIKILDVNNLEVNTATLTAGQTLDVHAGSYDADGNFTGDVSVTWALIGNIGTLNPLTGNATQLTATTAGTGVISADHATLIDDATGTITVVAGLLNRVRIVEGPTGDTPEVTTQALNTDQSLTVHAAGYDASGNYLGDFSVNWSVTNPIGTLSPTTGISTTLEANTPGVGRIVADHATAPDDSTGNITVTTGAAIRVKILSAASGETAEVNTATLLTGETLVVHAGSFDRNGNYIGDVSVTWNVSGGIGGLNPLSGSSTIFTASTVGTGVITAIHGTLIGDATGTITVQASTLSYVKVVEGPAGIGPELLSRSATTDQTITVHAAGYDASGNYLGDFSVDWRIIGNNIGSVSPTSGISTTFNPTDPGVGRIVADHATARDDTTGDLTISPGSLHHVKVMVGGSGNSGEIPSATIASGQTFVVHAAGFDADDNYLGDFSVDWSLTGNNIGTLAPATGVSTTLTARKAGVGQIKADHAIALDGLSGSITVTAGALAFIKVIEGLAGNGTEFGTRTITADEVLQFHAAGFDADTNFVGDQTVNWISIGTLAPAVSVTNAPSLTFAPTLAPASGTIRATHTTAGFDETGTITVNPGALNKIKILSSSSGKTAEVLDLTVPSGGTVSLHAAGFDADDNYKADQAVSWTVDGAIGIIAPPSGTATTFTAGAAGTGSIRATFGALSDNTGTITVTTSSVARVALRTQPNNGGALFGNFPMTADQQVTIYAAGYDAGNNFLGDVSVSWSSTGNLTPAVSATGPSFTFSPTLAAADNSVNGLIIGTYSPTIKDSTGTITVLPGAPSGTVTLTPNPNALNADGNATSAVNSSDIKDADGNNVGANKLFTVAVNPPLGTIETPDADPAPGHQIATNALSRLSFIFKAGTAGGIATITVTGGDGANGFTQISLGSLSIENITTSPTMVSQGQTGITVSMLVRNLSTAPVNNLTGQLSFIGSANRTSNYTVQAPTPVTLAGSSTMTLSFIVSVNSDATLEAVTINGSVQGTIGSTVVSADGTPQTDSWTVQRQANLVITLVSSPDDTVSQGLLNRTVTVSIANNPGQPNSASANVDSVRLIFRQGAADKNSDYIISAPVGPVTIAANSSANYSFTVNVGASATTGLISIDARAYGRDANSNQPISDPDATTRHNWTVVEGNAFRITSITPSQSNVTAGMAAPVREWTVRMAIDNAGTSPISLNLDPAKTFIRFIIGSQDVTAGYTISYPTAFDEGGTVLNGGETKHLTFSVTRTGSTRGIATIAGFAEGTDIPTNQPVTDNTNDGGTGEVTVQAPAILRIEQLQLSRTTVAQNMNTTWRVKAIVRNDGESDVRLHPSADSLKFSIGNNAGYIFSKPTTFATGDSILSQSETDSLIVLVTRTGSALGDQQVSFSFKGIERNSNRQLRSNTANATVTVQTPSALRILAVRPSRQTVSVNQTTPWNVTVVVRNGGSSPVSVKADTSTNLRFRVGTFQSDYNISVPSTWLGSASPILAGNATDSLRFTINQTGSLAGTAFLYAKVAATDQNSGATVFDDTTNAGPVQVQLRPNVSYLSNSLQPEIVNNNTQYAFTVRVRNGGANRATVLLDPANTKFRFNNGPITFEATLDANNPVRSIAPGDTTLTFALTTIPANMPVGAYTPAIELRGTENGNSFSANLTTDTNELTVAAPAAVQVLSVRPSQNTVTANMAKAWSVKALVRNNGGSAVRLDRVILNFINGDTVTADFGFTEPSTFLGSGANILNAGVTDSLLFPINRTGTLPGNTALLVRLNVVDLSNNQPINPPPEGSGSVVVQSRADVKILALVASRATVTRDQTQPWTVDMNVQNSGGSNVQLDFSNTNIALSLGGTIAPVDTLLSGGRLLRGNTTTAIRFTISPTGSLVGRNDITGQIRGTELNTGVILNDDTQDIGATFVTVQDPATLLVKTVVLKGAPNLPFVNVSQTFTADVTLENTGLEPADSVRVYFATTNGSSSINPATRDIAAFLGRTTRTVSFDITASSSENLAGEIFRASIIAGKGRNTGEVITPAAPEDDTARVFIQTPAAFQIDRVLTSETTVEAGRSLPPWYIYAVVTNNGRATMVLNKPSRDDVRVEIGGAVQTDYSIQADTLLRRNGTLQLAAGETDTVRYTVLFTGVQRGGQASLFVRLAGRDKNTNAPLSDDEVGQIEVTTKATVQIVTASPVVIRKVGELGFVNVNQSFEVEVRVQNISPFENVRDVRVSLTSDGRSTIPTTEQVIDSIKTRESQNVLFSIQADTSNPASEQPETFTAQIVSALTPGGQAAKIQRAADSTAQVVVQRPAILSVAATISEPSGILSSNQLFDFKAFVTNSGQAAVDDLGEVTLNLPAGFTIEQPAPDAFVRRFNVRVPADTVRWQLRAPNQALTDVDLQVAISTPSKDLNIDAPAALGKDADTVTVNVVPTDLKINRVYVSAPPGATDRIVSTDQTFIVNADLISSPDLERTEVKLRLPTPYRLAGPEPPFGDFVSWQVQAPNDANEIPTFLVVHAWGYDRSGALVERFDSTLSVVTLEKADLSLEARITDPPGAVGGNLSFGQAFTVTATLQMIGRAGLDDTAKVTLELRNGFTMANDAPEKIISVKNEVQQVRWLVTAPNMVVNDSLTVRITRRPFDENTNSFIELPPSRRFVRFPVRTNSPGNAQVSQWGIVSPLGATDGIVSTRQIFTVRAQIDGQNLIDVIAELKLPLGFPPVANALRRIGDLNGPQDIIWVIQAPIQSSNGRKKDTLRVELTGADRYSNQPVDPKPSADILVETVEQARLVLSGGVAEPVSARADGVVGLNTLVTVRAMVANNGQAGIRGNARIRLRLPDDPNLTPTEDYRLVAGDSIQTADANGAVTWQFRARSVPSNRAETIFLRLLEPYPSDANTDSVATVDDNEVTIPIQTEPKRLTVQSLPAGQGPVVLGANSLLLLRLKLTNEGNLNSSNILLRALTFHVLDRDGKGLNANQVMKALRVADTNNPARVLASLGSIQAADSLRVPFAPADTLLGGVPAVVDVLVDIVNDAGEAFRLAFKDTADVDVIDQDSPDSPIEIIFQDERGNNTTADQIISTKRVIAAADFQKSFFNYPNPFDPDENTIHGPRGTAFDYFLSQASDVELRIYTMLGELVYARSYLSSDPEGRPSSTGLNHIFWDGRNGKGDRVLNGVYLAMIKANGSTATTKVAVLKK